MSDTKEDSVSMEDILSVLLREKGDDFSGITEELIKEILIAETENIENLPAAKNKIESLVEKLVEKG